MTDLMETLKKNKDEFLENYLNENNGYLLMLEVGCKKGNQTSILTGTMVTVNTTDLTK